uniref:Uncharacterized protein n=1 Tax=Ciona savignyi TaxID=51511 RepID=H2Y914_CIOSA
MCLGFTGGCSPNCSITSKACSMISPTNTFATPEIAITTLWETLHPATVCMNRLIDAFGKDDRRYISYLFNCSSENDVTKRCIFKRSSQSSSSFFFFKDNPSSVPVTLNDLSIPLFNLSAAFVGDLKEESEVEDNFRLRFELSPSKDDVVVGLV